MPPAAKVDITSAVDAICTFADNLSEGVIPAYSDKFYVNISKALEGKWTAHNVYINFKGDRRGLRTKVFEKLGLKEKKTEAVTLEDEDQNITNSSKEIETSDDEDSEYEIPIISKFSEGNIFNMMIENDSWEKIKPVIRVYGNREFQTLKPGEWTDVIADSFLKQYRLPCAFSFKFAKVSNQIHQPFLHIYGKCKGKNCNNEFLAICKEEPIPGADLWLQVKCRDTRLENHESVQRQLRYKKRQDLGQRVLREGAANLRRNLARETVKLGDLNAPNLPTNDVCRKLLQECRDKELGINPKDGNNPVELLTILKYTPPYIGTIHFVGADPFQLQYLLPEQIFLGKEYFRYMKNEASVCIDSTSSLVMPVSSRKDIKPPAIFLFEIVINFEKKNISLGQMLSSALDTNTILFWLNTWLMKVGMVPKQAVCDYSYALLGGMSLSFNHLTINDYCRACFLTLRGENNKCRPAVTFIRIDVAHFIAIFCRLKCFNKDNKAIKDFFLKCIALMISSTTIEAFEKILRLTLIVSLHRYDGDIVKSTEPSPSEIARLILLDHIANEEHNAMKLIIKEESDEFKNITKKMESSGLNIDFESTLNESVVDDINILQWIDGIKSEAEEGKDTVHSRINGHFLPRFAEHLIQKSKEFVLWTGVMANNFETQCIRGTSCFVECDFGELKNRVIDGIPGHMRVDKFFMKHYNALKGQAMDVATNVTKAFVSQMEKNCQNIDENTNVDNINEKTDVDEDNLESEINSSIFAHESQIPAHSTTLNINVNNSDGEFETPIKDLYFTENWRNLGEEALNDDIKQNINFDHSIDTHVLHNQEGKDSLTKNHVDTSAIRLLKNGNYLTIPININNEKYIITNTCACDSVIQILATSAKDSTEYFHHVEKSTNSTCRFISLFIENGSEEEIYVERCKILKDFIDPTQPPPKQSKIESRSLKNLKTISCFSNVLDMWTYLMPNEASIFQTSKCSCGYEKIKEIPFLRINHKNIIKSGFKVLQESILNEEIPDENCHNKNCNLSQSVELNYNFHIIIETDVRDAVNLKQSLTCRVDEFPAYLILQGMSYRLTGIIIYQPGHYIALCRRASGNWETHNDMNSKIEPFTKQMYEEQYAPSAVVYVREEVNCSENSQVQSRNVLLVEDRKNQVKNDTSNEPNQSMIYFEHPYSILNQNENWRNKFDKEDSLLNKTIQISSTADKRIIKKRKAKDELVQRNPSKYFKACPDIHVRQAEVLLNNKTKTSIKLLQNGSKFFKPIQMDDQKYIVKNTCSFDAIIQILAIGSADSTIYLQHIQTSENGTCEFIKSFVECTKLDSNMYIKRCNILKDFIDYNCPKTEPIRIGIKSPNILRSVSCMTKILNMWTYLMPNEPSILEISKCLCGFKNTKEIPYLRIKQDTILENGFKALQKSLSYDRTSAETCAKEKCDLLYQSVELQYNLHVIIDTEMKTDESNRTKYPSCKVKDFPHYLTLQEETYRLTGIIHCNPDQHYIALCRRINGNWERHNDLEKRIHHFTAKDYNAEYTPYALVYIKV